MRQSSALSPTSPIRRLAATLVRWRWLITAGIAIVAAAFVIVARSSVTTSDGTTTTSSGLDATAIVSIVVAVTIALIAGLNLLLNIAGVDPQASEIAGRLAVDPDQQRLLTRWLERARWARFLGGLCGLLAWFLGTQAHGNLFAWGFGGIAAGALAAELHHFRRAPGPRTARLEVRSVRNYLWPFAAWHMVGAAAGGGVIATVGLVVDDRVAVACGAGAVAAIGIGHLAQRRVAHRPRPAIPDTLRAADDLARELAIDRNIAWPCTYFALSLAAAGALHGDQPTAIAILGIVAQFYAIGLWWRNRRLGLDFLLHATREPVLASHAA